jgi:NADH dehydrogenase
VRQTKVLAENIVASLRGTPMQEYAHKYAGSVASLGLHKGVAHVYGRKLKGYPAWLMHRVYHLSRVPTFNRKARVLAEWTLSGLFKREIVSLGSLEHPRAEFALAAGGGQPANGAKSGPAAAPGEEPKEQSADGSPDGPSGGPKGT